MKMEREGERRKGDRRVERARYVGQMQVRAVEGLDMQGTDNTFPKMVKMCIPKLNHQGKKRVLSSILLLIGRVPDEFPIGITSTRLNLSG